jgi:hypothetical protein
MNIFKHPPAISLMEITGAECRYAPEWNVAPPIDMYSERARRGGRSISIYIDSR